MSERAVTETTFHVRYAETDAMGVVHHAAYIVWFEEGRSAWMRALGSNYAALVAEGLNLSVCEVHAQYLAPALYGRQVTVRTWVDEVRSRAMTIQYEVLDSETRQRLATGFSRHICVDRDKRAVRIPERWRRFFSEAAADDARS
jgi:acyl-CoA thioester hydrolase